jgi:hypothetical protein
MAARVQHCATAHHLRRRTHPPCRRGCQCQWPRRLPPSQARSFWACGPQRRPRTLGRPALLLHRPPCLPLARGLGTCCTKGPQRAPRHAPGRGSLLCAALILFVACDRAAPVHTRPCDLGPDCSCDSGVGVRRRAAPLALARASVHVENRARAAQPPMNNATASPSPHPAHTHTHTLGATRPTCVW